MKYDEIVEAVFIDRPNRFIAHVELEGQVHTVHVKNTGRCRELLLPGSRVFLSKAKNPERKTAYDLISVYKENPFGTASNPPVLVNIDSQSANTVFGEYVEKGHFLPDVIRVKPEFVFGESRLDFYIKTKDREVLCEIKGVTLEENGLALFPDAPTQRGVKHLKELIRGVKEGYDAYAVFVVQMQGVHAFSPHRSMDPAFAEAFCQAQNAGVQCIALECVVWEEGFVIPEEARRIPVFP